MPPAKLGDPTPEEIARLRVMLEMLALRLPVIGSLLTAAETARVASLLATLAAARLPLVNAIALARDGARLLVTRRLRRSFVTNGKRSEIG